MPYLTPDRRLYVKFSGLLVVFSAVLGWFRKPSLYPLSYGGGDGAKCGAKLTNTVCAVVRKATERCTAQKVLQNSSMDCVILKV